MQRISGNLAAIIVRAASLVSSTILLATSSLGQPLTERIASAVVRDLCADIYWSREDADVQGHSWPLTVGVEGDHFYARVKFRADHSPSHSDFWGVDDGERASIRGNYLQDFEEKLQWNSVSVEVTVPVDCTPRFDPETPEKRRMIATIVSSTQEDLSRWRRQGIRRYPKRVKLLIADFNVHDLYTYVLVMPQKDVLEVALHDPAWKDDASYQRRGYISREIADKGQRQLLIPKIRPHSISRDVVLHGADPNARAASPSESDPLGAGGER